MYRIIGYLFMIIGVIIVIINCIINIEGTQLFGNFYLFVFSGFLAAAGLTIVFNEKEINKNEHNLEPEK